MRELYQSPLFQKSSLKGYWRGEDNLNDSSPSGYNLTGSGTPTYVTGKAGKAIQFLQASNQYASIADASCPDLEISGSQTWLAWVKPVSIYDYGRFMAKDPAGGTAKNLTLDNTGAVTFALAGLTTNATITSDEVINTDAFYLVCGVYDSSASKLKIWINGTKKEVTASGSATDGNGIFTLGRSAYAAFPFQANIQIDEAAIFSEALTDEEVERYYNGRWFVPQITIN